MTALHRTVSAGVPSNQYYVQLQVKSVRLP